VRGSGEGRGRGVTGAAASLVLVLLVAGSVDGPAGGGAAGRRLAAGAEVAGGRRGVPVPVRLRGGVRRTDPTTVLGTAVTAVAAELRAGRAPGDAWHAVLGVPVPPGGVPLHADVVAAVLRGAGGRRPRDRGPGRPEDALPSRVHAVLAATRLAVEVGAPLAPVLDGCARSLVVDADAETALRTALAGPRQTTTLLTALPLLGVLLGTLLGADPLGVLLGGGLGSTAGAAGLVLTLTGRVWVGRMVARARSAGTGWSPGAPGGRRVGGARG